MKRKKAKLLSFRYLLIDFIRVTGAIPSLIWFRTRIIYENEKAKKRIRGGALLISNHIGFFDPIYLMLGVWYRRHRFVCNRMFIDSKAGWFLKAVRCIPIDVDNFTLASLNEISSSMADGELVSMFPEGHINDGSNEMRQFKSGMVLMAMRAKVPIVPVYVKRHEHFYERLTMMIGEPVDIQQLYGERLTMSQIEEVSSMLYDKENRMKAALEETD